MWAYWVSRGQAISGAGVGGRDGQILELYSFNKAATRVEIEGFRTFLRLDGLSVPEPFRRSSDTDVRQALNVAPHEITLEHTYLSLGLEVEVVYHTIPHRRIPGLVRSVTIRDLAGKARHLEWLDGAPRILPYGIDQGGIKITPRHIEAMIEVGYSEEIPLYRLRQGAADEASIAAVDGANFMKAWSGDGEVSIVVDPASIFDDHFAFDRPVVFEHGGAVEVRSRQQVRRGRTPCGFALWDGELPAGGSVQMIVALGRVDRESDFDALSDLSSGLAWEGLRQENRLLIDEIADRAFTVSSSAEFDAYCRQNFLDNVIRGGMPLSIGGTEQQQPIYVFSHQNADLERDYHQFKVAPSYLSQGLGHFRNTLQNRRNDVFLYPEASAGNLRIFFGLIQLDGYNPLEVLPETFSVGDPDAVKTWASAIAVDAAALDEFVGRMNGDFGLGELAMWIEDASSQPAQQNIADLIEGLRFLQPAEVGGIHAGYWIDHWHYLIDLLESHFSVFPENVAEVLLESSYSWFDNLDVVVPRSRRYVDTPKGLRQLGSVVRDRKKEAAIADRAEPRFRARTASGETLTSSMLEKLVLIAATRIATLDPEGLGIEMEAGKPGWNDSLNGLPGLFGSGLSETIELRRLFRLLVGWLEAIDAETVSIYEELADLVAQLATVMEQRAVGGTALEYWELANEFKETYRERVRLEVSGRQLSVDPAVLRDFFRLGLTIVDEQLVGAGRSAVVGPDGIPHTYFVASSASGKEPGEFVREAVGPFLEGPMHWLREFPEDARAVYDAVRMSPLYDDALGMYKSSGPMGSADPELGRAVGAYPPGWLENESIYTHMEYKYLLEVLRCGLVEEFWQDAQRCLVPFLDPAIYGRSPLEGCSFIVSSAHLDPTEHGRGYQPRLSGMTAEFVNIWLLASVGTQPFRIEGGAVAFTPEPRLPGWLFTDRPATRSIVTSLERQAFEFPTGSFAFRGTHGTLVRYDNPTRGDTYGEGRVRPVRFEATYRDGRTHRVDSRALTGEPALALRAGEISRIDISLA